MTDTLAARLRDGWPYRGADARIMCNEAADALDAQAAQIAAQGARIAELEKVLLCVTDSLDGLGDESDENVNPDSWSKHGCYARVMEARAALRKEQEAPK